MSDSTARILVTGANGQLGRCLQDLSKTEQGNGYEFFFTDIEDLDICDRALVRSYVQGHNIGVLINAAAYTAVDQAEEEAIAAYRLNRDAVENLAIVCAESGSYLIQISTDYVFSGERCHPYQVDDEIAPQSIYGKSKAAGEQIMRESGCNGSIIRTSWLYSEYGRNFVKTMLALGQDRKEINVVSDQVGCPTYAGDLAKAIMAVVRGNCKKTGIQTYHYANEGTISWYDFSKNIMEIAGLNCEVKSIFTAEYPSKAPRPSYSVFDLSRIKQDFGLKIPYWRESLKLIINKLQG